MLITKEQVLAAFAAMGMAMTVATNAAHANGEPDDTVQYGPTEMEVDMSVESDADTVRPLPPTSHGIERTDKGPVTRAPGNFPFERVVVQESRPTFPAEPLDRPIFTAEPLERPTFTAEPLFRALVRGCVLTPREILFPYLINPTAAARCAR